MKKLKPCPYCGSPAEDTAENYCSCSNSECPSDCVIMSIEQWNHRPTEQAAEQRAAEAGDLLRTFATTARKLIVYRSKNTLNFQLEKADDFIQELAIAVDNAESFLEGFESGEL